MKNYKKQILLFLYVSLIIVIGSFSVLFINFRKQVKLQNEVLRIEKNLIQADSLTNNLLQIESDKRGFQLTSDVNYLKNFYRIKMNCIRNIARLRGNTKDEETLGVISAVDSLIKLRVANLDSGIMVFTTRGPVAAVEFMQLQGKKNIREMLTHRLDFIKSNFLQQLEANTSGINKRTTRNVGGLLTLVLIFILLMLVAARTFRRAQQKIIQNHIKFKEAQRIARIGSWEWDAATDKLKWSQEQFRIFGQDRKTFDLTCNGYMSHLSEEEQKRTGSLIADALEGKTSFAIEHEIIQKDGTKLMVFEQGTVLYDENGKATGMFGTTQDISERKKAEAELLIAQKKFQAIFDNTADGIYQSTIDGKFIMANPSMANIFGYDSPEELISSVTDIGSQIYADPADRKRMSEIITSQGHIENYELRVVTKHKQHIWVSANIRIVKDDKGGFSCFEGTLEDISERKKAEEQLLHLSNRLQLAIRATAIGIWDWDIVNNTTEWDDEMFRMYDVKPDEYPSITAAWEASLHPDDLERVKEELTTALQGEKEYDTGFRIICKDKSVRYIKGNALVLYDQAGSPVRMIGTNGDITQRKNAEEEILQLNKNLEQFANITAHDLQEPIRMVSGFLGLLDKKYADIIDAQGKSYIDRAKDGADRMSILIKDLLEFSRSGNKAAKKEPVDLSSVLELVHKDMSIVMQDTSASLHVAGAMPVVVGTQSALYRLFLNLVSNGIKFRKKDTAPKVTICMEEDTDSWVFTVQDNGIGVPEKDQPKLFQAFQRLHRKEDYPGTGLGLVTCKKIVETHGGRIWMTSEYGKGTGFHFTLPKMRA
ncbi:MAG: PAS domain-containing protein [Bacteroidota bacterium]